jgi:uncharacterized repeat protein (TIGR01451 family)
MKSFRAPLFLLLGMLTALTVQAAPASGSIELQTVAQQQKVTVDKDGTKHTEMVPAARVLPGTEVLYTVNYSNTGAKPANAVVVNDPVPVHMSYVAGSAMGDNTTISFSVDGGKTWASSLDTLTVKNPDNTTRPATEKDCTNIRWVVNGNVAAGGKGSVSFRAVLQ